MKQLKRSLLFLTMTLLISAASFAQLRKIPASATENFKAKYPNASEVEWKANLSNFTAHFKQDGKDYNARFNNKGEWIGTDHGISIADVPEAVNDGLKKSKYADWETGDVTYIELPNDDVNYRVQVVKSDIQKKNLLFSKDGRLLKDNITL